LYKSEAGAENYAITHNSYKTSYAIQNNDQAADKLVRPEWW